MWSLEKLCKLSELGICIPFCRWGSWGLKQGALAANSMVSNIPQWQLPLRSASAHSGSGGDILDSMSPNTIPPTVHALWIVSGGGWFRPCGGRRSWLGCGSANIYLYSTYYLVLGAALGSASSVVNKTDRAPVLLEFRVSREERCLSNKLWNLMEQAQMWYTLQRQHSGGGGRAERWGQDTVGSQGGLPWGGEAAPASCLRTGGGAGAGTESGPKGYRKAGKKTKIKVLFYFLCCNSKFLKAHLEKKGKWFQELLCFTSLPSKLDCVEEV